MAGVPRKDSADYPAYLERQRKTLLELYGPGGDGLRTQINLTAATLEKLRVRMERRAERVTDVEDLLEHATELTWEQKTEAAGLLERLAESDRKDMRELTALLKSLTATQTMLGGTTADGAGLTYEELIKRADALARGVVASA